MYAAVRSAGGTSSSRFQSCVATQLSGSGRYGSRYPRESSRSANARTTTATSAIRSQRPTTGELARPRTYLPSPASEIFTWIRTGPSWTTWMRIVDSPRVISFSRSTFAEPSTSSSTGRRSWTAK